ncbi:hypothetical protein AAHA92_07973 [Salvia divinorum]|uniref:TF-B3 domain-containing protein n=1 Tax=Salvia divinorum TaxID=28513 RepID=A0ABD1HLP7_SALDI
MTKWRRLRWNFAYSSTRPPTSKNSCVLEFCRDEILRRRLRPADKAAVENHGLTVPTMDNRGRRFRVLLKNSNGYLTLSGEGWSELVRLNFVNWRGVVVFELKNSTGGS